MTLARGQVIDRWLVTGDIGRGGHAMVYRGFDTALAREVALKVDACPRRARHEASLLARVSDRHVVTLYSLVERGGLSALVLEYIEGLPLEALAGDLTLPELFALCGQLAAAVDALHRCGIVHGDLKPANMCLAADGVLKLFDLGSAQAEGVCPPQSDGTTSGTIAYLAPECLHGAPPSLRSDIWSTGAVLFELATGQRAFDVTAGVSGAGGSHRCPADRLPRLRDLRPECPAALDAVVARAMRIAPDDRFESAAALAQALAAAIPYGFTTAMSRG